MFDGGFAHYISYGATDQQTARMLVGRYDGLLVPGTVAAFQREGTGGFVLTLSATATAPAYAIDPRFPLFQQQLHRPKKSHVALAALLGVPGLVMTSQKPAPADFTDEIIEIVAQNWALFNGDYQAAAGSKFEKYARRLGEDVKPRDARAPSHVLPPYLVASGPADPWWSVSTRLFDATLRALNGDARCVRVVAASDATSLAALLALFDERVAVWVSGLDELASPADVLASYARTIRDAASRGARPFALYGGFFSVLMQNVGLTGASHGIGFGEYRKWIELPESGPPPARFYLPQLHRYVQPDEAARLYFADRRLAECSCEECGGEPPLGLDYHALMRHSVRCRAAEIEAWSGMTLGEMVTRVRDEWATYRRILRATHLPDVAIARTERQGAQLDVWADALDRM